MVDDFLASSSFAGGGYGTLFLGTRILTALCFDLFGGEYLAAVCHDLHGVRWEVGDQLRQEVSGLTDAAVTVCVTLGVLVELVRRG